MRLPTHLMSLTPIHVRIRYIDTHTNEVQYIEYYVIKFNKYLRQVGGLAFSEQSMIDFSVNKNRTTVL